MVIPSAQRPKLVVPRRPLRVAAAAVRNYNTGSTRRERLEISALATAVRAGFAEVLPDRLDDGAATTDIRAHLCELFAEPVAVGLYIGPARAVRKPVVQVLDRRGATIAFAKLGVDEFTQALVRAEAATLSSLATASLRTLVVPDIVHHGTWNSHQLLVLQALRRGGHAATGDPLLARAMDELARVHGVEAGPLAGSGYRHRLEKRLRAQAAGPLVAALIRSLDLVSARYADAELELGAWHGDWTPWNMTVADARILVWDWEKFDTGTPLGFDAIHYALHWTMAVDGASTRAAFETTLQRSDELLAAHGIDAERAVLVFWLYVIDLAVRYLEDDEMNAGATALSRMTEWLPAVLGMLERRTRTGP